MTRLWVLFKPSVLVRLLPLGSSKKGEPCLFPVSPWPLLTSAGQRRAFSVHVVFNKLQGTGLIISMGVESLGSSHASGDTILVEGEASSYWVRVEGPTGHVVATSLGSSTALLCTWPASDLAPDESGVLGW